jgi:hypothetical protein
MNLFMLADTVTAVAADPMISGTWIIGFMGALGTFLGIVFGHQKGKAAQAVRLESPLPEMQTRKIYSPPSYDAHLAVAARVAVLEAGLLELRREMADLRRETTAQYQTLLQAGSERELHLSDKLDGIARSIHSRIDEMMKPRTRTPHA